jgi:glycosyltransferase involved in cell wall biosynthesis
MHVLHVIHQFPPESRGGSESYVYDIAQRQRELGLLVEVLSGSKHWRPQIEVEHDQVDGLPVHRLHRNDLYFDHHAKMWHPEVEATVEQLLREWRPQLVHVHHWVRLTCNLVEICARLGIPAVVTLHDYYTSCPRAFRRRADDAACQRPLSVPSCLDCVPRHGYESQAELAAGIELFADHYRAELAMARAVLVAVGSTADLLAASTGLPRERYEVLPLGYRLRWPGQPKLPAPHPEAPLRFAFWGGVGRHKGVEVAIAALREVLTTHPGRAELVVLGAPESAAFEQELQQLASDLPVRFLGAFRAPDLRAAAPHVGVFPSTCLETYGIVLDECLELGLPCITSDLGALPERSAGAGLVTRAGDAGDVAVAMRRFLDEPGLWAALAAAVPVTAPDLEQHVAALLSVYERARAALPGLPVAQPVTARRRVAFLLQQRESALGRAAAPEGPR